MQNSLDILEKINVPTSKFNADLMQVYNKRQLMYRINVSCIYIIVFSYGLSTDDKNIV